MNLHNRILMSLIVGGALVPVSRAQYVQQGGLLGDGAQSAAVSTDGNTAILGGFFLNYPTGSAWIVTQTNAVWSHQGMSLPPAGSVGPAYFGSAVGMSGDGSTVIVGGPGDNGGIISRYSVSGGVGAVWIFTRSNGSWLQQGNKLVGTGAVGGAAQGQSVALSADGNTAIVGGPADNNNVGAVWIYTQTNGVWLQQGDKLATAGGRGPLFQGWSVGLSAGGNTAIVGGVQKDQAADGSYLSSLNTAWVYTRTNAVWSEQDGKLTGSGSSGAFRTASYSGGASVSISADGNTAILGDADFGDDMGGVMIFKHVNGVWTQYGSELVAAYGANIFDNQGSAVALSGDASTLIVVGSGAENGSGGAWAFVAGAQAASASVIPASGRGMTGIFTYSDLPVGRISRSRMH